MNGTAALAAALVLLASGLRPPAAGAVDRGVGAGVPRPAIGGQLWSSDATAALGRDLEVELTGAATLHGAHVGLLVLDTRSGAVLFARNADDAFVPASTLKLLTGSVALATLGPGYRFQTNAYLNAARTELIVRVGGDPLLAAADLETLAHTVRAIGITALPLGVRVDATAFERAPYPPGWSWDDFPYDYAPVLSAAVVEENTVHLTISPGSAVGQPARVSGMPAPFDREFSVPLEGCPNTREVIVVPLATTSAAGSATDLRLGRQAGGCITVTGSLPLAGPRETLDAAVPDPVGYLRTVTIAALARAGVTAGRLEPPTGSLAANAGDTQTPPDAQRIWSHAGEPLADVLADMWWPSDNLIAEQLLKAVGASGGRLGTIADGATVERAWLAGNGVDPQMLSIADGSGLSVYDRITPRALGAILQADWNGPYRDIVLGDLPIAGIRGTLERAFAGSLAERRTFAKTGSVRHARGLAGYLATLHHGAVTFAWSVDDWLGDDADLAALRARVLSRIIGD